MEEDKNEKNIVRLFDKSEKKKYIQERTKNVFRPFRFTVLKIGDCLCAFGSLPPNSSFHSQLGVLVDRLNGQDVEQVAIVCVFICRAINTSGSASKEKNGGNKRAEVIVGFGAAFYDSINGINVSLA